MSWLTLVRLFVEDDIIMIYEVSARSSESRWYVYHHNLHNNIPPCEKNKKKYKDTKVHMLTKKCADIYTHTSAIYIHTPHVHAYTTETLYQVNQYQNRRDGRLPRHPISQSRVSHLVISRNPLCRRDSFRISGLNFI